MSGLSLPLLLLIFAAAAAAVWIAGTQLSNQTDVLSARLHLGAALGLPAEVACAQRNSPNERRRFTIAA